MKVGDNLSSQKDMTKISDIVAVQVLSERVRSNKSSYTSIEINFALQDGSRVNLMDHGDHFEIYKVAEHVAEMLRVPVLKKK